MAQLVGLDYDQLRTLAAPATTFFTGGKFADRSQAMDQNLKDTIMSQYDKTGIMSGALGYSDFDKNQTPGTEFPNLDTMRSNLFSGDMSLPAFSNATTLGRVNYDIDPNTGKVNFGSNAYNFRPEMATIDPSDPYGQQAFSYFAGKANERNREINPDISIPVDYLRGYGRDFSQLGDVDSFRSRMERMSERPSENTLQARQTRQASSPRALGAEDIKEKGIFSLGDILADLGRKGVEGFKDVAGRGIASQGLGTIGTMLTGNPLIGGIASLAGLFGGGDMFNSPYIGAGAATVDEYGNMYSAEQLDKMNARGGYYTDPARASRRRDKGIINMIERRNKGLAYGKNRLAEQLAIQEAETAARQSAADAMRDSNRANRTGGYQSSMRDDTGFMEGPDTSKGESFSSVQGST